MSEIYVENFSPSRKTSPNLHLYLQITETFLRSSNLTVKASLCGMKPTFVQCSMRVIQEWVFLKWKTFTVL